MRPIDEATRAAIRNDLRSGRPDEAARRYAEAADVTLAEAVAVTAAFATDLTPSGSPVPGAPIDADFGDVLAFVRAGRKIQAIQRYRELTHESLSASKDAVERLADAHGIGSGTSRVRGAPRAPGGFGPVRIVVAVLIAIVLAIVALVAMHAGSALPS